MMRDDPFVQFFVDHARLVTENKVAEEIDAWLNDASDQIKGHPEIALAFDRPDFELHHAREFVSESDSISDEEVVVFSLIDRAFSVMDAVNELREVVENRPAPTLVDPAKSVGSRTLDLQIFAEDHAQALEREHRRIAQSAGGRARARRYNGAYSRRNQILQSMADELWVNDPRLSKSACAKLVSEKFEDELNVIRAEFAAWPNLEIRPLSFQTIRGIISKPNPE